MVKKRGTTAIAVKKQKKKLFTNPKKIVDEELKARFDMNKSWMTNLADTNLKEMYSDKLPESIPDKAAWTIKKLSENHVAVLRKLIAAHGDTNFKKMAFDRKLNKYQWTEDQCEKKVRMLLVDNLVHVCEYGKCPCGVSSNSSHVKKKN
jgi:hypothetical protein